eukprot:COSAG05_NODE_307_length_11680_cov_162.848804_6_plen_46_part_00
MRVLAEIGARGVDGQRPVTLARLVSQADAHFHQSQRVLCMHPMRM